MRVADVGAFDATCEAAVLKQRGFVYVHGPLPTVDAAWAKAAGIVHALAVGDPLADRMPAMEVVGEFTLPPPGTLQRDFQTLHLDFGIPLGVADVAVARYTALHVKDGWEQPSEAVTRLVLLESLWRQRRWVSPGELGDRLGRSTDAEGVLARVVEAADESDDLPTKTADFLCGMEFSDQAEETAFFQAHSLDLAAAEDRVVIAPGGLLVFDNLRCAHGRTGRRTVGELRQLCFGYRSLPSAEQTLLRDLALGG